MTLAAVEAELAKRELKQVTRELARRSLLEFTTYTKPEYIADPAHVVIANALDAVVRGRIRRLMIFAPPQHGKTELASVRLPPFWLMQRPNEPVLLCSYGASLAESKSRQAREILESPEFAELSEVRVDPSSRSVGLWELAPPHRGQLLAAGVGGAIMGHGGMLGIIDDPYSSWAEAYSETVRASVWDWYRGTFRPRMWEGGAIVIVNTRWHEDDLCARLLAEGSERWTVLRLPAVGETQDERDRRNATCGLPAGRPDAVGREVGEALCPTRFSEEALAELKRDVGPGPWEAEYMGTPAPPEGALIKAHWWRYYDRIPDDLQEQWISVDCAFEGETDSDYVVMQAWGRRWAECYLLDQLRERMDFAETLRALRGFCAKWPQAGLKLIEKAANGPAIISILHREISGLVPVLPKEGVGDRSKRGRAQAVLPMIESGNVYLPQPERHPWVQDFIAECSAFDKGAHDDQVDAMTQALNRMVWALQEKPPKPPAARSPFEPLPSLTPAEQRALRIGEADRDPEPVVQRWGLDQDDVEL